MTDAAFQGQIATNRRITSRFVPTPLMRALGFIVLGLLAWLALAGLAFLLLPSGETSEQSITAVAEVYFHHAMKNGVPTVFVAGLIAYGVAGIRRKDDAPLFDLPLIARQAAMAAFGLAVFALMIFAYSTLKVRIPTLLPFAFDKAFADIDRALFLGTDPWAVFQSVYEVPSLMRWIDKIYSIWAGLLAGSFLLCFGMAANGKVASLRLPIALMLVWFLGGNVMALLLSSAGPCYYALVVAGPDVLAAQMEALRALPPGTVDATLDYQVMLWNVHEGAGFGFGGISAMPSMHCATSLLFVCALWRRPVWRCAAIAFAAFIWVSSVVLAWHYAVDGLFAIPLSLLCWWISGRCLSRAGAPALTHVGESAA